MMIPFEVRRAVPALGLEPGESIELTPGAPTAHVLGANPRDIPCRAADLQPHVASGAILAILREEGTS